jgi:transposase
MKQVTTIGLDIAKSIFQVHGVDAAGQSVLRQRLSRNRVLEFFGKVPPCLVGLEACASLHYWAREFWRQLILKLGGKCGRRRRTENREPKKHPVVRMIGTAAIRHRLCRTCGTHEGAGVREVPGFWWAPVTALLPIVVGLALPAAAWCYRDA